MEYGEVVSIYRVVDNPEGQFAATFSPEPGDVEGVALLSRASDVFDVFCIKPVARNEIDALFTFARVVSLTLICRRQWSSSLAYWKNGDIRSNTVVAETMNDAINRQIAFLLKGEWYANAESGNHHGSIAE